MNPISSLDFERICLSLSLARLAIEDPAGVVALPRGHPIEHNAANEKDLGQMCRSLMTKLGLSQLARKLHVPDIAWIQKSPFKNNVRFFTPSREITFCGHATLASGLVMRMEQRVHAKQIYLKSTGDLLRIQFQGSSCEMRSSKVQTQKILSPIGYLSRHQWFDGGEDYLVLLNSEKEVLHFKSQLNTIKKLNKRGLVVTASDRRVQYALRFFAPQSGIDEDPCTGSVQSALGDLWKKLQAHAEFRVLQLSNAGGLTEIMH